METWNREELYEMVWQQPLVKLAAKYGISAVMLGKVCKKLKVPLPGRGYWAKKEFGKRVERTPLPQAKDLPVVQRLKLPESVGPAAPPPQPQPEPTDPEYLRIKETEAKHISIDPAAKQHELVAATAKALRHGRVDTRGFLEVHWKDLGLDVRVSAGSLDRALSLMNAVILAAETEKFPVSVERGKHGTTAIIFGQKVPFAIVEKYRQKAVREVKVTPTWTRTEMEYRPSGELEFQVGEHYYSGLRYRDSRRQRLEDMLPKLLGAMMREGRSRLLAAERAKQVTIERRKKELERIELGRLIDEEEKKVQQLEEWVLNWAKARQMREFIAEVEKVWAAEGHDLSPDQPKGQRIVWMKQQANRQDPFVFPKPASILDRKPELHR